MFGCIKKLLLPYKVVGMLSGRKTMNFNNL